VGTAPTLLGELIQVEGGYAVYCYALTITLPCVMTSPFSGDGSRTGS